MDENKNINRISQKTAISEFFQAVNEICANTLKLGNNGDIETSVKNGLEEEDRTSLVQAIQNFETKYLKRHANRSDSFDLKDTIFDALNRDQRNRLWGSLFELLQAPSLQIIDNTEQGDDLDTSGFVQDEPQGFENLVRDMICQIIQIWLDISPANKDKDKTTDKKKKPEKLSGARFPDTLFRCIEQLHSCLFHLAENSSLQTSIMRICEFWWQRDGPGKEHLVTHLLPVLLIRSLESFAKRSDVKRVYGVRSMIEVLDLEDETALTLKHLLLRCFISPVYLSCKEGIKFLCELFWLHEDFIEDIHATIKAQIPFASNSMISAYADIYFKAWKGCQSLPCDDKELALSFQDKIENFAIQDLMDCAVHSKEKSVCKNVSKMLELGFHVKKNVQGVDEMLVKLYQPILWGSLNAANPLVRKNAMVLLATAFPLRDPNAAVQQADELLQKQFSAVEELMYDACPQVRVVAIEGACRILSVFWELIPKTVTSAMLTSLAGDLVHDKSSPAVRAAVFNGLTFVIDNPLAQVALKKILPQLSQLIHDRSPMVRTAVVKLLLRVKSIRSIRFYDVVPVKHLLERLSIDTKLQPKLVTLLLDSFYPQGVQGSEQLQRVLSLIQTNSRASRAFFSNLHHCISVGGVCKLAMLLNKWVKSVMISTQSASKSKKADKLCYVYCALDGISLLWNSVSEDLRMDKYKSAAENMHSVFSYKEFLQPMLSKVFAKRENNETQKNFEDRIKLKAPLLEIAGRLECDEKLRKQILDTFTSYNNDGLKEWNAVVKDMDNALGPGLRCLCLWKREASLLRAVDCSLKNLVPSDENSSSSTNVRKSNTRTSKRSKSKAINQGSSSAEYIIGLQVCLWTFQWICSQDREARKRMLNQEEEVEEVLSTLSLISQLEDMHDRSVVLETIFKLSVHRDIFKYQEKYQLEQDFEDPTSLNVKNILLPETLKTVVQQYTKLFNSKSQLEDSAVEGESDLKSKKRGLESNQEEWESIACVCAAAISDCVALSTKKFTADDDKSISAFVDSVKKLNINGSSDVMFEKRILSKIQI